MAHKARLAEFDSVLQADKIDLAKLQELCFTGIPDEGGRRALCWRLLLHYLPLDRATWAGHLRSKRKHYHAFVDDMIVHAAGLSNMGSSDGDGNTLPATGYHQATPYDNTTNHSDTNQMISSPFPIQPKSKEDACINGVNGLKVSSFSPQDCISNSMSCDERGLNCNNVMAPAHEVPLRSAVNTSTTLTNNSNNICSDHPLNLSPDSEWGGFFKDNEVLGQIDKDVRRLCPDMCFFQRATQHPRPNTPRLSARVTHNPLTTAPLHSKFGRPPRQRRPRPRSPSPPPLPPGAEAHWEVLERVLFVYAKLNPGQGYVQGMNEIVGPLYYVLATTSQAEHAEADTFWLFTALMAEVRDLFIRTLDDSESGIGRLMARLMAHLALQDPAIASRLRDQGILEQFFAFRWLSLLFSQEFALPDVIRVWDSLLSRQDTHTFLLHFATAMICLQRDLLLGGDFASNMKLLQNYPPCDVAQILHRAEQLARSS